MFVKTHSRLLSAHYARIMVWAESRNSPSRQVRWGGMLQPGLTDICQTNSFRPHFKGKAQRYVKMRNDLPSIPVCRKATVLEQLSYLAKVEYDPYSRIKYINRLIARQSPIGIANSKGVDMLKSKGWNTKFVNVRLSDKDKSLFVPWLAENEADFGVLLQTVLTTGHKLSLSYSGDRDVYFASISCVDETSANYQSVVTSFHPDSTQALWLALYKFVRFLVDVSWDTLAQTEDFG